MGLTTVVNRRDSAFDIYIGRGSKWGNPFSHLPSSLPGTRFVPTREEAIERYCEHLAAREDLLDAIAAGELDGARLGCYCFPLPCHGNTLAMLANATGR